MRETVCEKSVHTSRSSMPAPLRKRDVCLEMQNTLKLCLYLETSSTFVSGNVSAVRLTECVACSTARYPRTLWRPCFQAWLAVPTGLHGSEGAR